MKRINLTHSDLDGVTCAILLKKVYPDIDIYQCTYKTVNGIFEKLIKEFPTATYYITDMSLDEERFVDFLLGNKNVHLIDHHPHDEKFILGLENKVISMDRCGCKLVLDTLKSQGYVFSSEIERLVEIVNDYDMWIHKFKFSKILNRLYSYYRFKAFLERFKDGIMELTSIEKEFIKKNNEYINTCLKNLEVFEIDERCYLVNTSENYIDEIAQYVTDTLGADTVFIYHKDGQKLCVRGSYLNYGEFLKGFGGGGHPYAASVVAETPEKIDSIIQKFLEKRRSIQPNFS